MDAADAALLYFSGSTPWFDIEDPTPISGTAKTQSPDIGSSAIVIGTGTNFTTDIAVNDLIEIDYQYSRVLSVDSASQMTLEDVLLVSAASKIRKLNSIQYARRKALAKNKLIAMQTAKIEIGLAIDLPDIIGQDLIDANCYRALEILKTGDVVNRHQFRHNNGIKREKVGDSEVEYFGRSQQFSTLIRQLLNPYLKSQIGQMNRIPNAQIDPNYFGTPYSDLPSWPKI